MNHFYLLELFRFEKFPNVAKKLIFFKIQKLYTTFCRSEIKTWPKKLIERWQNSWIAAITICVSQSWNKYWYLPNFSDTSSLKLSFFWAKYMDYGKTRIGQYFYNSRLWKFCFVNPRVCLDAEFLLSMCKIFPFQVIKTVRLRLKFAQPYMDDKT